MTEKNYKYTIGACFVGYIVQAIINNFAPLLFLTFQSEYGVQLDRIALIVTINFGVQLLVDFATPRVISIIGYRACIVFAHLCAAVGFIGMATLPDILENSYLGLILAVICYAIGGGIIEVLVSPIVESCPTKRKEATMSLLHSFYCWGYVAVIILSTIFFHVFGISNWRVLACIWAIIPLINMILFMKVPMVSLEDENGSQMSTSQLFRMKSFWILMFLMMCAGACEQSVSQWASAFAEMGLGVSKTVGDLAGPMMFAVLMGLSRVVYAKYSEKIKLSKFMLISGLLCIFSYMLASLTTTPIWGLLGCVLTGLSVGIMWPGTFSIAAKTIKSGGAAMFAFMALAGDLGCSIGPGLVGIISDMANNNLKIGILVAIIFPVLFVIAMTLNINIKKHSVQML